MKGYRSQQSREAVSKSWISRHNAVLGRALHEIGRCIALPYLPIGVSFGVCVHVERKIREGSSALHEARCRFCLESIWGRWHRTPLILRRCGAPSEPLQRGVRLELRICVGDIIIDASDPLQIEDVVAFLTIDGGDEKPPITPGTPAWSTCSLCNW